MRVENVNNLNREGFIKIFGNIVEHFPKIASELYPKIPFQNVDHIIEEAYKILDYSSVEDKETILKLHPDLAGKLTDEGKLTNESTQEQKAAGLDNLSEENKKYMNKLNEIYKAKFKYPFVICARENKADTILKGLKVRLNNSKEEELIIGINEVKKICKLRIEDIFKL